MIAGLTLLDKLAIALEEAARLSKEIAGYIKSLMRRILTALGVVGAEAKELTSEFIKWVLRKFTRAVYELAVKAMQIVHFRQ